MDEKVNVFLDGSKEKREEFFKKFYGLRPDQSFQDLDVDEDENE